MSFLLSGNPIIEADGLREVEMPFKPQVSQSLHIIHSAILCKARATVGFEMVQAKTQWMIFVFNAP